MCALVTGVQTCALPIWSVGPGLGVDAMAGEVAGEAALLDRVIALTRGDQHHLLCRLQQRQSGAGSDRGLARAVPGNGDLSAEALAGFRRRDDQRERKSVR